MKKRVKFGNDSQHIYNLNPMFLQGVNVVMILFKAILKDLSPVEVMIVGIEAVCSRWILMTNKFNSSFMNFIFLKLESAR